MDAASRPGKPLDLPEEVVISVSLRAPPKRSDGSGAGDRVRRPPDAKSEAEVDAAIGILLDLGFKLTGRSRSTLSLRAPPSLFSKVFGSHLVCEHASCRGNAPTLCRIADKLQVVIPANLRQVVSRVVIESPVRWLTGGVSATPPKPKIRGRSYLNVLDDVPKFLNVRALRAAHPEATGAGIRLTMIDSGFAHSTHPFFTSNGFVSTVICPNDTDPSVDAFGHGTGVSAHVFAVAPGVAFTGIKIGNQTGDGSFGGAATLHEALQRAIGYGADPNDRLRRRPRDFPNPHVISLSVACTTTADIPSAELFAVEQVIEEAVRDHDIVVVAAGGNLGEEVIPGSSKDVISVGGAFFHRKKPVASDYASAYTAFDGRQVPDLCGLCGPRVGEEAPYIMLPVPPDSHHATKLAGSKKTGATGWARFSGTSAATPQVAAVCALLRQKNPHLRPDDIKRILMDTATEITEGEAFGGERAAVRFDRATGAGLVDAKAAWEAVPDPIR
jgi:subtilisin family serine protease